jgi:surface protein
MPAAAALAASAWHGKGGRLFVRCGVDRLVVGSQAFYYASAFNANIGGWNTASVTTRYAPLRPSLTRSRATEVRTRQWPGASSRGGDVGFTLG